MYVKHLNSKCYMHVNCYYFFYHEESDHSLAQKVLYELEEDVNIGNGARRTCRGIRSVWGQVKS